MERPSIHSIGAKLHKNVSVRFDLDIRFADCHPVIVYLVDHGGTPNDPSDDHSHKIEFDLCMSRRDVVGVLPTVLNDFLRELAEINTQRSIVNETESEDTEVKCVENVDPTAAIMHDLTVASIARSASLEINVRPMDNDILVEFSCGFCKAEATIPIVTASEFFVIMKDDPDQPIPGDVAEPIIDVEEEDVDHALEENPNAHGALAEENGARRAPIVSNA